METNSFFFPAAMLHYCLVFQPRGLSSAVNIYAASPRCFDGASLAQHDRENTGVIPSVAEESRGNELFLLPRGKVVLLFSFAAARVK